MNTDQPTPEAAPPRHKRRVRYSGKHPRKFDEKYKERNPAKYAETVAKVLASGKTPAGTHRPIMVTEIMDVLTPQPGETVADCTLGFGGHAQELLGKILPKGKLIALDVDPIELPKTETRLRELGFGPKVFTALRSNFAGLAQVLAGKPVDMVLADLGVSSMQIDDPSRGFSVKQEGPLDMRMNPQRGQPASALLERVSVAALEMMLAENSDEPHARELAPILAGKSFATTRTLANAIRTALPRINKDDCDLSIRRVFQALRIAVNDEFSALDTFLRNLPMCLKPGGRVAIMTFHSGEDRRVKKAFEAGMAQGFYTEIAQDVIRPTAQERNENSRSGPAKLRWAKRGK